MKGESGRPEIVSRIFPAINKIAIEARIIENHSRSYDLGPAAFSAPLWALPVVNKTAEPENSSEWSLPIDRSIVSVH